MKKNFIYSVIYEIFRLVVPLLTTPYISRVLGASGIGTYTLAHTYSQYFILFAGLGFATYAARELAYVRDDKEKLHVAYMEIFMVRTVLLLLAIGVYAVCFFVLNRQEDFSYRICMIYLVASIFDVSYYFKAIENFKTVALRNIMIKVLGMVLIFCMVKEASQVWLYTLILALSELLGQVMMVVAVEKRMWKPIVPDVSRMKGHLKGAFSLFIPALAVQMYTMLDKVMVGGICGEGETGFYENAQKMVRLVAIISSTIVGVFVPRMSYLYAAREERKFAFYFGKVFKLVSFLVFPMCFGLMGVSDSFSVWYFGKSFEGIEQLLILGAPLVISLGWSGILGNMILVASGNQKYYTIAVYVGAGLNICINLLLIPEYGAAGAMIGSLIAEFSGMLLMMGFCRKKFPYEFPGRNVLHYLCASVLMFGLLKFMTYCGLKDTWMDTALEVLAGAVVYLGTLMVLKDSVLLDTIEDVKKFLEGRKCSK